MTNRMDVRLATADDTVAIAEVHVGSWQAAYVGQIPQDHLDGLSVEQRLKMWDQILETVVPPRSGVLVLSDSGAVVGFLGFGPSRDDDGGEAVGEVGSIYLVPGAWGRGGGRLLMEEGLRLLREGGYQSATLWVLDSNARARRFYEAGGWRSDDVEKVDEQRGFLLREVRYVHDL